MPTIRKKPRKLRCPALGALIGKGIYNLDEKELGCLGQRVTGAAGGISSTRNKRMSEAFLTSEEIRRIGNFPYFLTASSAKVMHSLIGGKWLNVVMYLSPADESLLSFWREYGHDAPHLVKDIVDSARRAAKTAPAWKGQSPFRPADFDKFHREYDAIISRKGLDPNYILPNSANMLRPLSMCPYASPNCRAVCLNTSGQGGLRRTDLILKRSPQLLEQYKRLAGSRLDGEGYTFEDDLRYLYLKGHQAFYGGAANDVIASRLKKTHLLLLAWARQGVLSNTVNDMIFYEALQFKALAGRLKIPMALRLNGTSDLPVETLKLRDAEVDGVNLRGRKLVDTLGQLGIVCYDYTKDYRKMDDWMARTGWKNADAVTKGKINSVTYSRTKFSVSSKKPLKGSTSTRRFPDNYYLCFSWSEVNGKLALQTLSKGGNVVMVFRRSYETPAGEKLRLPTAGGGKGALPDAIRLAQLSRNPQDAQWEASVINGDATDLRFDDGHHVGEKNAGIVVGLVAKGEAQWSKNRWDNSKRKHVFQAFTLPARLKEEDGKIYAVVRRNPGFSAVENRAVESVDGDLLDMTTSFVDSHFVTTTAMGT